MLSRWLATIANGGKVPPGAIPHAEPDPVGLGDCDRCPQSGMIHLERGIATLVLCGHHYTRLWAILHAGGWEVTRDLRVFLDRIPTPAEGKP